MINILSSPCFYRANGAICLNGSLFDAKEVIDISPRDNHIHDINVYGPLRAYEHQEGDEMVRHEAIMIEGTPVLCPACEGRGRILTNDGKEMIAFFQVFLRPMITDMIEEILETKL